MSIRLEMDLNDCVGRKVRVMYGDRDEDCTVAFSIKGTLDFTQERLEDSAPLSGYYGIKSEWGFLQFPAEEVNRLIVEDSESILIELKVR